jgi:beta-glucosidase
MRPVRPHRPAPVAGGSADRPVALPPGFRFGVSDSGHQSEGGYNQPGEPANNWRAWERSGRAEPAGIANQFWDRYPEFFERAEEVGLDAYRMSVEWTRCVPQRGVPDVAALEHYGAILRSCRSRGLEPVVALHHFTHPEWLGPDFWLDDRSPDLFAEWVELAVAHLAPYCSRWMTINEINAYAIGSYLIGYFPPGKRIHRGAALRAIDNMLAAHIRAYEIIHRIQPEAQVGTSTYAFWSYDVDRLLIDVLAARSHGVEHRDTNEWFGERRRAFHRDVTIGLPPAAALLDRAIHRSLQEFLRAPRALSSSLAAAYDSPHERCLDVTQVNYYAPQLSKYLCMPGRVTAGARRWRPDPKHWEQVPAPEHFANYLKACHEPGHEIWILENGMCNPVVDGRSHARPDRLDRAAYYQDHLGAIVAAVDAGVEVTSYFTWALFDNYQWGEYESCFGLYAVRRDGDEVKYLDLDAMGHDAAGSLRTLIDSLRAGDRTALL